MFWRRSKWLAAVLTISLSFLAIAPQTTLAVSGSSNNGNQSQPQGPSAYRSKDVKHLIELKEQRDQHTKYYRNSDGSITAESTINSRHYKDSQGQWQDISNKIVSSNEPGFALQNEANAFQTMFSNTSAPNFLAKIKLDSNIDISWNLENANTVNAVQDTYSITYPEIAPNTDLQYQPYSDGLKENIILKNINAPNAFAFEFMANGLKPVLQNDGSIALQDSNGSTKLVLPKPYMYDQNRSLSQNVNMSIQPTQNPNRYIIYVSADLNWLGDPNRAYPITIDPSTQYQSPTSINNINDDTYVTQYYPNYSYYSNLSLFTGYDGVNNGIIRSLLKFSLPSLPTGTIVTDAMLSLYKTDPTSNSEAIDAFRISQSWDQNVTWNSQPNFDTNNVLTEAGKTTVPANYSGWVNLNVWSIVKGWYNGNIPNYGFMVTHNAEGNPLYKYYASDAQNGLAPMLSVTYISDEIGLNPYWSYANTPIGSVNTTNGNLISSVTDFALPGRGIPITVTRTYNNRGNLSGIFGQKWFSNLDMQLQLNSWGVVLTDSAGTERPFMLKSDGTYIAPDNYPVQLYKDPNGEYKIQEANQDSTFQSKLPYVVFDSSGKLKELHDGKGNMTKVTWNTGSVVVTDPSGRSATLSLSNGTVSQITMSQEQTKVKASYSYSGGYLQSVTYDNSPDPNTMVNYHWAGGLLNYISDKNGNNTYINYNGNNQVISIGTQNLLSNPSLEAGSSTSNPVNWSTYVDSDYGSMGLSTVNPKYGKSTLDIHSSDTVYPNSTTSQLYAMQQIPVKPGTQYTFSSFIKTASLNGNAFLNVKQLDGNGNTLGWSDNRLNALTGTVNQWTQSQLTFTTSAQAANVVVYLEVEHDNTHFGGDAYFDGAALEEGQNTDYYGHTDFQYGTDSGSGYTSCWVTVPTGEVVQYESDNYGTPAIVIKDLYGQHAETDMTWDAADHLRDLMTPVQVAGNKKAYQYEYDPLGNLKKMTDPNGRATTYEYYYNRLKNLTQADGTSVQTAWNPINLDMTTTTDQTYNTKGYGHDDYGNTVLDSNILGLADNRVLNSGFEAGAPSNPTFSRSSGAYTSAGSSVATNAARYETGQFGQGVTVEEGTTNTLTNPFFANGLTGWSAYGSPTTVQATTQNATYGGQSIHVVASGGGQGIIQNVTLNSGADYAQSVRIYVVSGTVRITHAGADYYNQFSSGTGWQTLTNKMDSSAPRSNTFYIYSSGGPAEFYVDAAQLEQKSFSTSFTDSSRSGESITLPTTTFTPTQGTIEAWVKPTRDLMNIGSPSIQMITDVAETGNNGLVLALNTDGRFYIQAGTGSGLLQAYSTTIASKNNWYYVAGKWDATGVSIYVNGVKQGSTSGTPAVSIASTPTIGRESQANQRWFDGIIDDVRISNKARPDSDIQSAYQSNQPLALDASTTYKLSADSNLNAAYQVYQPTNWFFNTPSGTTNQVEYNTDSTAPFGPSQVLHLKGNGAAQHTDFIDLTGIDNFILSGYIKTANASSDGAYLNVYWYDSGKNLITEQKFFGTKNIDWQHFTLSIDPNIYNVQNAAYAKVEAATNGDYDAYFDDIQFEKSTQVRDYNMLENSSFERGFLQWTPSNSSNVTPVNEGSSAYTGIYDAQITRSSTGSDDLVSQSTLPVNLNQWYTLSGHITTNNFSASGVGNGARMHVLLYNSSGQQVNEFTTEMVSQNLDSGWTKYVLPFQATSAGTVKVKLEVINGLGTVKFDNIRLSNGRLANTVSYDTLNHNYVFNAQDQLNNVTQFENDLYGQATHVTQVASEGNESTQYSYNGQEQLKTVTDNAGNVTAYQLDNNGNVTSVGLTAGTATYDHSTFTFDRLNQMLSETDANNHTTNYAYDEDGRLIQKTNPDTSSVNLSYDGLGNLSEMSLSSGADYRNTYDLDGRLTGSTVYSGGSATNQFNNSYDNFGHLTKFLEYDGSGTQQITQISGPGGPSTDLQYDAKDQLQGFNLTYLNNAATIANSYVYSKNGLVTKATADGKDYNFNYDEGGRLLSKVDPSSTEDRFDYDAAGRITRSRTNAVSVAGDKSITSFANKWMSQYTYNTFGQITQDKGFRPDGTSYTTNYTYNIGTEKLNRLTQADISGVTYNYTYDPAGNLLTMDVPGGHNTFTYGADNEIASINGYATAVNQDVNGNLTKLVVNGKTYNYVYDSANRLIGVKDVNGSEIVHYTYDASGLRLNKTANGVSTSYHYFQGRLLYETLSTDPSNVIHALYVWSPNGALEAVSLNYVVGSSSNNYYYYHYNAQGDVVAVTDGNGAVYRQYVYDPYGNVISVKDGGPNGGATVDINNDPGFNNAYTYRGYRYDTETGLYFLNARYYAAGIGRFLTKDTFKGVNKNPQSLNRYAYTQGDPINHKDSDGHQMIENDDGSDYNQHGGASYWGTGAENSPASNTSVKNASPSNSITPSPTISNESKRAIDNGLLAINRGATAVSIGASIAGIVGTAIGSATLVSAAGIIIPVAAVFGIATTLGMRLVGDQVHGSWGNVAISLTGFLSVPMLGGAALLEGTELYNAARGIGFAFNIPLSAETANWN